MARSTKSTQKTPNDLGGLDGHTLADPSATTPRQSHLDGHTLAVTPRRSPPTRSNPSIGHHLESGPGAPQRPPLPTPGSPSVPPLPHLGGHTLAPPTPADHTLEWSHLDGSHNSPTSFYQTSTITPQRSHLRRPFGCPLAVTPRQSHLGGHTSAVTPRRSHLGGHTLTVTPRRSHSDGHTSVDPSVAPWRSHPDSHTSAVTPRQSHLGGHTLTVTPQRSHPDTSHLVVFHRGTPCNTVAAPQRSHLGRPLGGPLCRTSDTPQWPHFGCPSAVTPRLPSLPASRRTHTPPRQRFHLLGSGHRHFGQWPHFGYTLNGHTSATPFARLSMDTQPQ
uniref:Uncharacterized protein n=1 Tax=Nelumbo nucifera TaxID=4432 RepID=A0A822YJP1_NELNU|nr:TPA_asm: hypothetical protein HUJ06_031056 [Nelumbo nucifera]